jgi:CRP-like cAMP-binding protein
MLRSKIKFPADLHALISRKLLDDIGHVELVMSKFQRIDLKRNEQLLNEGDVCKHVYFITQGCLQAYVYGTKMLESTKEIVTEGNWYCDLRSFKDELPATENIRAVEASQVQCINRRDFIYLVQTIPRFGAAYQFMLEAYYAHIANRVEAFVALSASDRIRWLMDNRPELMTRLPSKLIASYLAINKDVFSRLRAKL